MFADVVQRPTFAEEEVARSRTQAVNALRVNLRQPGPLASLVLNRLAFGAAPYGAPSSGTPDSVAAMTRDQIDGFHDRWWRPDNAALIITGGMEPEEAFAFAAAPDVDAQAGIAMAGQIGVHPLVAPAGAVMLAVRQVFQDRRVPPLGRAPEFRRQPGAVRQRDPEVLDHLDPMRELAAD